MPTSKNKLMNIYFRIHKELEYFSLDVEYAFDQGTLIVEGESGAGKSTLINCIAGLVLPDSGRIVIDGTTVFEKSPGASRPQACLMTRERHIGFLFQNYALFPHMSVYDNIIYGIKNHPGYKDKQQRAELSEYAEYIMETFHIEHLRHKSPSAISGGERQRAAFARAIVTRPKLLLLDEPFSALDPKTKRIVYEEFQRIKSHFQIPTILITHDPQESALLGDHIIKLHQGQMTAL